MLDLKLHIPVTDEVEVGPETLAAIDRGIAEPTMAVRCRSRKSEN
jgi:hypothetical protein